MGILFYLLLLLTLCIAANHSCNTILIAPSCSNSIFCCLHILSPLYKKRSWTYPFFHSFVLCSLFQLPPGSLGLLTCRADTPAAEDFVFPNQNLLLSDEHLAGFRLALLSISLCIFAQPKSHLLLSFLHILLHFIQNAANTSAF